MKVKCKNCIPKEGMEIPDFNQSDKIKLWELKLHSSVHAVKVLIDDYKLSHGDAKYIAIHINVNYGKCNRCIYNKLDGEYLTCPKCGALNFNWKINDHEER